MNYEFRHLSGKALLKRNIREISVRDLNEAVMKFSDSFLRGAVSLSTDGKNSADAVELSAEYTAYMFRLMVQVCERGTLLYVRIESGDGIYTWRVDFGTNLPKHTAMCKIKAAAEKAGFTCKEEGTVLLLSTRLKHRQLISVYAASRDDVERVLFDTFFL